MDLKIIIVVILFLGYLVFSIDKPESKVVNETDVDGSKVSLMYYQQIFSEDLKDPEDIRKVSLDEAKSIVNDFYSTGFKKGDVFLIGFYKDKYFYELSKDDKGKVNLMRVEDSNGNVTSESFDQEDAIKSLVAFWDMQ